MKAQHDWHKTPLGRVILFLGSIRFAIPILVLTTGGLIYGTWVESTQSARQAGILVYGSWWFIGLMLITCLTLILAVVTRYPWRKRHTGFIIVHASLIVIIISGFITFFTNVEGDMALQEGMSASSLRTGFNELQILSHSGGEFELLDAAIVENTGPMEINGVAIDVLEIWDNTTQNTVVLDDGANKLHAVHLAFGAGDEGHWVGQLQPGETPPMLHEVEVRVLPEGKTWEPPNIGDQPRAVFRHAKSEQLFDLGEVGDQVADGWTIESIERFDHAIVGLDGLTEGEETRDNPAVQVILVNPNGSRERHTAFDRFRGSINKKQVDGEEFSELVFEYVGHGLDRPTLAFFRNETETSVLYVSPAGDRFEQTLTGEGPWTLDLGGHECTVLQAYANARGTTELVEAPEAAENAPALRLKVLTPGVDGTVSNETMTLVWGRRSMIEAGDQLLGIAYGPSTVPVPFTIELIDFRKKDYPGSGMAMAYESDVIFTDEHGNSHEQTIWMNNPLEYKGWKVYQSGFVGSDVSIFQIAKDPGLIPMYIGCTALFVGFILVYYTSSYTQGHPGMPKMFESKKKGSTTNAFAEHTSTDSPVPDDRSDNTNGNGSRPIRDGLEIKVLPNPDPRPRTHHANGHLRTPDRGRDHRTHEVG